MTEEFYNSWREQWQAQHPDKTPPTFEQFSWLCEAFNITPDDIGLRWDARAEGC